MNILKRPNWFLAIGAPLFIFLCCIGISLTTVYKNHQQLLSTALLIDLVVVAPFIYYLAIRKSRVPIVSVSRIFILGLLLGTLIMSVQSNMLLHFVKTWVSPIIELGVIFIVVRKFNTARKQVLEQHTGTLDFLIFCRGVMAQVVGNEKIGHIIASEIAVLYYACTGGKNRTINNMTIFSSYKKSGIIIVLWAILAIFLIETAGVHFLLGLWSTTAAWVITALSVYTCVQLFAHIRAVKARPIQISNDTLILRNGLAGDAIIPLNLIAQLERSKKMPIGGKQYKLALIKGFENHNMVVYLKSPIVATKLFGIKITTDTILFFVDEPESFTDAIMNATTTNLR